MGPGANPGGGPMMQGPGGPGMAGGPGGYMGQQGYGEPSKGYINQGMYGRTTGGYAGGPGGYTGRWVSHPHTFQQLPSGMCCHFLVTKPKTRHLHPQLPVKPWRLQRVS